MVESLLVLLLIQVNVVVLIVLVSVARLTLRRSALTALGVIAILAFTLRLLSH
jgi:hypothetical protein